MVDLFQTKFLATMNSFIPNKILTINDREAPWVTPEVKTVLRKNKRVFKRWIHRGRKPSEREIVNQTQCATSKTIRNAKSKYLTNLGNKICDPNTGPKCFWTAFNRLLNNKKITNIPPLIENDSMYLVSKRRQAFSTGILPSNVVPSYLEALYLLSRLLLISVFPTFHSKSTKSST